MKHIQNYKSLTVATGRRTYFLDLGKTKKGGRYLKIAESVRQTGGEYKRNHVVIFEEHLNRVVLSLLQVFRHFNDTGQTSKQPPPVHAYAPWTAAEDQQLELLFRQGTPARSISQKFKRNPGAIQSRIRKLKLYDKYI